MAHYPVNHHLRGVYRVLTALCGLYLIAHGVVALVTMNSVGFFARGSYWSLGLRTNPAGAWLAILAGLVVAVAAAIGGNVHHRVNLIMGWVLIVVAIALLAVQRTDANVFNISVVNVIALLIIAVLVLASGLYGKVDPDPDAAGREHETTLSRG